MIGSIAIMVSSPPESLGFLLGGIAAGTCGFITCVGLFILFIDSPFVQKGGE